MSFAGARFASAVLEAASGKSSSSLPEYTYVDLDAEAGGKEVASGLGGNVQYFSVPVQLGKNGVEKILPLGKVNDYEQDLIKKAVADLSGNVSKGVSFVSKV